MPVGEGQSTAGGLRLNHLVKNEIHIMFIAFVLTKSQHFFIFQHFAIVKILINYQSNG